MASPRPIADSALCDFLLQLERDSATGSIRALADYLPRFPGHEEDVAREYLAYREARQPAADGATDAPRFEPGPEIGRGGMGIVRRVRDTELRRDLALKILRRDGPHARRRFLEEARITGRLDHPGVVPVHRIGADSAGRPFFTMRLVEGLDFEEVIRRVHAGDGEWTMTRALDALIKLCDTMAFAHARGIVHRDLKPANVRVGRFGEVYVMDWGLARDLSAPDAHDLRLAPGPASIERDAASDEDFAVVTLQGDVLGTPAYMPPEQARGDVHAIDARADVYAAGAMLYHLLTGARPYDERRNRDVLERVRHDAPVPVLARRPRASRELAAIAEKAMARDPSDRYADMGGMGRDLRAFLEQRVVGAYRSGPFPRLLKWVARNRVLAGVLLLALAGGAIAAAVIALARSENRARIMQLSGPRLGDYFAALWPPHPGGVPAIERWIGDARSYLATQAENQRELERLRARALPRNADRPAERRDAAHRADLRRQRVGLIAHFEQMAADYERGDNHIPEGRNIAWVRAQVVSNTMALHAEDEREPQHLTYEFADADDQRLFDALSRIAADQSDLQDGPTKAGLLTLAERGLAIARGIERDSLLNHAERWRRAIASIADPVQCPDYRGLEMKPQLGLVPLGRDPDSGLWEFWHVATGAEPLRDERGRVLVTEDAGVVLVLLPGGGLERGSQALDPQEPNYDPWAEPNAPVSAASDLDPFFLGKFELTQAQWLRIAGRNCSTAGGQYAPWVPLVHPVESMDHPEAVRALAVVGLVVPTEAQWEFAARAGTRTPWHTGHDPCSLIGRANFADRSHALEPGAKQRDYAEGLEFDDGVPFSAPVGSFAPNRFGLHDTAGNVREWCSDRGPFPYNESMTRMFTSERIYVGDGTQAVRGGSYSTPPSRLRTAARDQVGADRRAPDIGLRPARNIER